MAERDKNPTPDASDLFAVFGALFPVLGKTPPKAGDLGDLLFPRQPHPMISDIIRTGVDMAADLVADFIADADSPVSETLRKDEKKAPDAGSAWSKVADDPTAAPAATAAKKTSPSTAEPAPAAAESMVSVNLDDHDQLAFLAETLGADVTLAQVAAALHLLHTRDNAVEPTDPAVRLTDRHGRVWARVGDTWMSPDHGAPMRFQDLNRSFGPLTQA